MIRQYLTIGNTPRGEPITKKTKPQKRQHMFSLAIVGNIYIYKQNNCTKFPNVSCQ